MSKLPNNLLPPPDGWTCPYRTVCWQREAVRLLLTVLVAWFAVRMPGCAIIHIGPTTVPVDITGSGNPQLTIPLAPY